MSDDATLLRRYAETGSESAFAEIVRRHVDLVYAAALRRTGGASDLAADVAQDVFTKLARKAGTLSQHPVLSAWLHTATRYAALNLMLSEQRRKHRERLAATDPALAIAADPDWEHLRPVLDSAIDELSENDRAAVVLRFLERKPFAEIGAALRVSEDAARVRTDRAVDKLRAILGQRGITSSASALGALVAAQPAIAAPGGLAASLATAATATAGAGLLAGASLFMSTKFVATGTVCALVAVGIGAYFGVQHAVSASLSPPAPIASKQTLALSALEARNTALSAEVERLRADVTRLNSHNAQLVAPSPQATLQPESPASTPATPAQQQQAMTNNLRQLAAAADQFMLENARPSASYADLVGPDKYVKRLMSIDGEDYTALSFDQSGAPLTVTTQNGVSASFHPQGTSRVDGSTLTSRGVEAIKHIAPAYNQALTAYRAAHQGQRPPTAEALFPYFTTAQEVAEFQAAVAVLQQEALLSSSALPTTSTRSPVLTREAQRITPLINRAREVYRKKHGTYPPSNAEVLLPYFATPQDAADYLEYLEALTQTTTTQSAIR